MKYLLAIFVLFALNENASAAEFRLGQEVIFRNAAIGLKGVVVETEPRGGLAIDFGDESTNIYYGRQPTSKNVRPYQHTDQLVVRAMFSYPLFTLKIGDAVIYKDSVTWMKGNVVDLTVDGLARVDFHSQAANDNYQYIEAKDYLTPAQ